MEIRSTFAVVSGVIVIGLGAMAGYKLDEDEQSYRGHHVGCIYDRHDASVSGHYDSAGRRRTQELHISNNLTLVSVLNAGFSCSLAVIMYTQAVSSIPRELDECAYMDGCKRISFLLSGSFFRY